MRILIAEDDLTSRMVLEKTLEKSGYEVISTINGKEAFEKLSRDDSPMLAIVDWMMPEIDGPELCNLVKAQERENPIYMILLTAKDSTEDIISGLESGADDYVIKPFKKSELLARIRVGKRMIDLQLALIRKIEETRKANEHVSTLQGLIPICMYCHKIGTNEDGWDKLESYIEQHSTAEFSHSICPQCLEEKFPEDVNEEEYVK
ncbi:MAG: response regulator [Candidatus Krumholzibacteriota bacterium]|nr:response regulator [Candidatus Krumholzibacteriota bacterium]